MKKSLILLVFLWLLALSAFGQKNDSAFIKAFNSTFDLYSPDSIKGVEGQDYQSGIVFIYLGQQEINLVDFLKDLKKTDPILKGPVANTLLDTLGIHYSLIAFSKSMNLVAVGTRPGQSVKDAIADIKKSVRVKIKKIEPYYYKIIYD